MPCKSGQQSRLIRGCVARQGERDAVTVGEAFELTANLAAAASRGSLRGFAGRAGSDRGRMGVAKGDQDRHHALLRSDEARSMTADRKGYRGC
jgi:hypothetical protein